MIKKTLLIRYEIHKVDTNHILFDTEFLRYHQNIRDNKYHLLYVKGIYLYIWMLNVWPIYHVSIPSKIAFLLHFELTNYRNGQRGIFKFADTLPGLTDDKNIYTA